MTSNKTEIESLLEGLQKTDPRLHMILRLVSDDIDRAIRILIPDTVQNAVAAITGDTPLALAPLTLTYQVLERSVRFNWTSSDVNSFQYELRKGTVWDTSFFQFRTSALQADINPIATGITRFILRSINSAGIISVEEIFVDVVVPLIGVVTITASVIDNNVNLYWTIPTSPFKLDYYIVKGGLTHPLPERIRLAGNFFPLFEIVGGLYYYSVTPVDIAGNLGPEVEISIHIDQPPDFQLMSTLIVDLFSIMTSSSTHHNCYWDSNTNRIFGCISLTETWHNHFASRGWNSIADQVAAGYNMYALPSLTTGDFTFVNDYGGIIQNVIINVTYTANPIIGSVSVVVKMRASDDNITWTAYQTGTSAYFPSIRYLEVRFELSSADDKSLVEIYNIKFLMDVKLQMDSGSVMALSTDTAGTVVTFNKPFKDINSLTLTCKSLEPLYPEADFIDIPNPTTFKVLVFDSAGKRVTYLTYWKARGIM